MPQTRMSETHYFISFILFLSSSAHKQSLGGVLQKIGSATVLKPIKKILAKEFNFSLKLQASSFVDFEHRCSCILFRLAILRKTYSNIFVERLQ